MTIGLKPPILYFLILTMYNVSYIKDFAHILKNEAISIFLSFLRLDQLACIDWTEPNKFFFF